jgi:ABC-type transport system involved in multi-copper enzyme maturation permease subunit
MKHVSLRSSVISEWIKFRSVRSTMYSLATMFVLSLGIGTLIDWGGAHERHGGDALNPLTRSLAGHFFAQFVVGVIGAMIITSEYSTGSIRNSLAAVPRRTLLVFSKIIVLVGVLIVTSEILSFAMFGIGQAIFKGHIASISLSTPGALRGVLLCGVLLTLLCLMGFSFGLILRRTPAAITLFVVVILIIQILVAFLPHNWGNPISRYLPSTLGEGMLSINQDPGTFAPYGCALILAGYVAALIAIGVYQFNRRDA